MFTNILVPTDGTENSRNALERAVTVADAFDATVHLLSVAPSRGGEQKQDQLRSDPDDAADEAIRDASERLDREGIDYVTSVPEGEPDEQILAYADANPIDLIVMGTHGRTGLDRVLLGSVAEKTVRNAHVPVMTVPPADEQSSLQNR